ncbi:hypothetical protein HK100_007870, partial [Physocladia obscura]
MQTQQILQSHFQHVEKLHTYLEKRNGEICKFDAESEEFANGILVAFNDANNHRLTADGHTTSSASSTQHSTPRVTLFEIIDHVVELLVLRGESNILSLGFRPLKDFGAGVAGMHGIEAVFPNTIVSLLKTLPWQKLLKIIGPADILHLLTETSLFCSLPNNCLFQISGHPFAELPKPSSAFTKEWLKCLHEKNMPQRGKKRDLDKIDEENLPQTTKRAAGFIPSKLTNSSIIIPRFKIFYKRQIHSSTRKVIYGLPQNRKFSDNSFIFYVTQSIFPAQFGLPSPFSVEKYDPPAVLTQSQLVSRLDFNPKADKIPWRLSKASKLIGKMLKLHIKCDYRSVLFRHCPRKIRKDGQISIMPVNVLTLCTPHDDVSKFIRSIIRHVIPHDLWGTRENEETILSVAIDGFVRLPRFESVNVEYLLRGIK